MAACALTGTGSACAVFRSRDYVTGQPTFNRFDLRAEIALGDRLTTLFLASAEALGQPIDRNDAAGRRAARVMARLLSVPENRARMPPLPWELHAIGSTEADAWCFPGGRLVALTGLASPARFPTDDALAALLGHELAHAAARHGTEQRSIEDYVANLPFAEFFGDRLVQLDDSLAPAELQRQFRRGELSFSVLHEHEADLLGLEFMARAGYAPEDALQAWGALLEEGPASPRHPARTERLAALRQHLDAARYVAERRLRARPTARHEDAGRVDTASVAWSPEIAPPVLRSPTELLSPEFSIMAGTQGEALRVDARAKVGLDLVEDGLPLSAELTVARLVGVSEGPDVAVVVVAREALAVQVPLTGPRVAFRRALAPLRPGRYRARLRVTVGALEADSVRRFDVMPRAREPNL